MWNLKFMEHKNHKKSALQGKKWRFFADYATFARERLPFLLSLSTLIAGLLLLLAAGLKAWQIIHSPVPMAQPLGIPGFTPALIGGEIFLGLWLLSGALPTAARRTAIGCFTLFASYAFWEALAGKVSCGCFGQVRVNPWITTALDAAMVVLLIAFRREPSGGNGTRTAPSTKGVGHPARQTLRTMAAKAASQQNAGHSRWPVGTAVIAGVLASITVSILHPRPVAAGHGLLVADGGKIVILEPHKWLGQRLPVLKHIRIGKQLAQGRWVVMFYHADCDVCRHTIPVYEALAMQDAFGGGPRVAFVRVPSEEPPSPPPAGLFHTNLALHGALDESHEWFAATPMAAELRNGRVIAFASGSAARNADWVK